MFTLSLFLMFGYLFVGVVYFGFDRDVVYFIGRWPLFSLLWIPIFGIAHWRHVKSRRPNRQLMMGCVFPAGAAFFLVSWVVMHKADRISHLLRSAECSRAPELKELHTAAMDARAFHASCLANSTDHYRLINYCPGYDGLENLPGHVNAWPYLRALEYSHGCAGFCNPKMEPSMWTYQGYEDTCAAAVANVMRSKVSGTAFRMMMYSVFVVFVFLAWIEIMLPTLKAAERADLFSEGPGPGPYGATGPPAMGPRVQAPVVPPGMPANYPAAAYPVQAMPVGPMPGPSPVAQPVPLQVPL